MAKKVPMKLKYLRVNPHAAAEKTVAPCAAEMISLMTCWRQNGVDATACAAAVKTLSMCSGVAVTTINIISFVDFGKQATITA